jgi:hypothetical protein
MTKICFQIYGVQISECDLFCPKKGQAYGMDSWYLYGFSAKITWEEISAVTVLAESCSKM